MGHNPTMHQLPNYRLAGCPVSAMGCYPVRRFTKPDPLRNLVCDRKMAAGAVTGKPLAG
jgi:hypothetical protein